MLAKGTLENHEITWLNLQPLFTYEALAGKNRGSFVTFYESLIRGLPLGLPYFDQTQEPPMLENELFAFRNANTMGSTTVDAISGTINLNSSKT